MRKLILKLRKLPSSVSFIRKSVNNITSTFAKVKEQFLNNNNTRTTTEKEITNSRDL